MKFNFNPYEWHHLYFGILLLGLYFYVGSKWPHPSNWYVLIALLGCLIIIDDLWQHLKQGTKPEYRSYLNRLFGKIWSTFFGSWWPIRRL